MDKSIFLRGEYDRIVTSGDYVWSGWRDSFDRFQADLWDRTPSWRANRHLAPRDPKFGFAPENVEWHFTSRKVATAIKAKSHRDKSKSSRTNKPTPAERRAAAATAKEERRQKLVETFRKWEPPRRA